MSEITTVGIDLAKNILSVHGVDARGKAVLRKVGVPPIKALLRALSPGRVENRDSRTKLRGARIRLPLRGGRASQLAIACARSSSSGR